MRLHRFIGDFDLKKDIVDISDIELANQIRNVLRLKIGDSIIVSNGQGSEAEATIIEINKKFIELSINKVEKPAREPKKELSIYVSLLKRENFELVVQKATELGVSKIVPLITERTVKTGLNKERIEKIIKEASEQSGRTTLPELLEPQKFEIALNSVPPKSSVLFDLTGEKLSSEQNIKITNIFIGPEGGFSEKEVTLAKESGITIGSLGELTLRAETASIVSIYSLL